MAQETFEAQTGESVTTTVVTSERVTTTAAVPVVDWEAAPVYQETVVEETAVVPETGAVPTYYAPRGRWEFTDAQRIIVAVLLWLNIIIFVLGALLITGRLSV